MSSHLSPRQLASTTARISFVAIITALIVYLEVYIVPEEYRGLGLFIIAWLPIAAMIYFHCCIAPNAVGAGRYGNTSSNGFIPIMVHQLRAPLVGTRWGLAMLLNGEAGALKTEQKKVIEESYHNIEKLMSYIRDILSLTSLDHYEYTFSSVDISGIMQTALHELEREAKEKKITIHFNEKDITVPQIEADPAKIGIVIENLLENAIKYTIEGGTVSISVATEKAGLHIAVTDSGIGIPKAEQSKIFDQFFRAKNAQIAHPHGSGIGLYISQDIVRAHHGKIWFESTEGVGSTFHVLLPYSMKEGIKKIS